jgi:hypothetical protein
MTAKIFKVEAQGDIVYINAESESAARQYLNEEMGEIPRSLLKFSVVDALPDDEEFL